MLSVSHHSSRHKRDAESLTHSALSTRPPWLRRLALFTACMFLWNFVLAAPTSALTHAPKSRHLGIRHLSKAEMKSMLGSQTHGLSFSAASGPAYPWEGNSGGTNTGNGNKLTSIPIVSWTQRGGLPFVFSLTHNSQSPHNEELGDKWTHSFDIYQSVDNVHHTVTMHWGNDLSYTMTNVSGVLTAPPGVHDTGVVNIDNTITITRPDQTQYHFNTSWYCDWIADENGNTISITRNTGGYVTSVADATGRTITLGYTGTRITSITDPLSRSWSLSYSSGATSNGVLHTVSLPTLNTHTYSYTIAYDSHDNINWFQTPAGNVSTATYNSVDSSLATSHDACGNELSYTYTSGQTVITDSNSHSVTHTYTSSTLTTQTDPASSTVATTFSTDNQPTQVTDQRGKNWVYTYDSMGNVLTATDPLSNTTTYTYNSHNKLLTTTDPLSHVVTNTYDSHDNLLTVSDGLSHATTFTVDGYGQRLTATDALSHETQYGYSTNGDLTSVTDANSNETTATFDTLGRPTETTDALSHSTTISYDAWERPISVTTPAGTTSTTYNLDGAVLTVTDGNSNTVTTTVDADNRPTEVLQANGDAFYYYYDGSQPSGSPITGQHGLLSATKDGNGHCTYFSYDSLNRKSGVTYPDSTTESWTYDAASNIASHTDGNGATISYSYANDGALTTVTYPSGSGAGTGISYTLDNARRQTGMTDQTGTTSTSYDAANRVTQISAPNGTTGYGYDNANRRTSMTLTQGTTVSTWSYTFDAGNRQLTTVSPFSETTTETYDVADRVTSETLGNGAITDFSYDTSNRITEVQHFKSDGTTLLGSYSYTYDPVSNVLTRSDNDGSTTTWQYDASDQVTSEVRDNGASNPYSISYTYDHNHNRTSKTLNGTTDTYSYDNHDHLLSTSSKSYSYDSNGNCKSVTVGTNVTHLSYDIENRVIGISYPGGGSNSFVYNGEDLRTQKVDSTGTYNYACDGDTPASAVLADGAATYTPGLSENRSGTSKFYHGDALGSTRGITNASETATDSVLYDGFGMTVSRSGSTPTPFGFVGKEQYQSDSDSGLQLLGHRYYDPSIGRFLSQDPSQDGTNWYAYCDNNPLDDADPTGLKPPNRKRRRNPWHKNVIPSIFGGKAEPVIDPDTGDRKIIHSAYGPYDPKTKLGPPVTDDPGVAVPNPGKHRKVTIQNPSNGKTITVPIVDKGPADDNPSGAGIDLTTGAADNLGIGYTPGGTTKKGRPRDGIVKGHPRVNWKYAD